MANRPLSPLVGDQASCMRALARPRTRGATGWWGVGQAAAILQRRATPEERAAFEADYSERLLNPYIAAERGYVDAVVEPAETRQIIGEALRMLIDKRERIQPRPHDNTPL